MSLLDLSSEQNKKIIINIYTTEAFNKIIVHKETIVSTTIMHHIVPANSLDPSTLVNTWPPIRSDTLTLNWYCSPSCSPDTTPQETLAGKVTVPETTCLLLLPLPPFTLL